jgi:hypothetical protein
MINKIFLDAAVEIRKKYIENLMDIERSTKRLDITKQKLSDAESKMSKIIKDIELKQKKRKLEENLDPYVKAKSDEMISILQEIEDEGESLENYIKDINEKNEKLIKEEIELKRLINQKHPDLKDEEIKRIVIQRIEKEGLL